MPLLDQVSSVHMMVNSSVKDPPLYKAHAGREVGRAEEQASCVLNCTTVHSTGSAATRILGTKRKVAPAVSLLIQILPLLFQVSRERAYFHMYREAASFLLPVKVSWNVFLAVREAAVVRHLTAGSRGLEHPLHWEGC